MNTTTRVQGIPGLIAALPLVVGRQPDPGVLLLLEDAGCVVATLTWPADTASPLTNAFDDGEQIAALGGSSGILLGYRCEPGAVDLETWRASLTGLLDLHHVVMITDEHWWVEVCTRGCCDGALKARPAAFAPPVPGSRVGETSPTGGSCRPPGERAGERATGAAAGLAAAWERLRSLPADACESERCARSTDLLVVTDALLDPLGRDLVLELIAPELLRAQLRRAMLPGPAMSSEQMAGWAHLVPPSARGPWEAASALALWREGRNVAASATARRSRAVEDTSLARLVCGMVRAGLTYEIAVARAEAA